MHPAFVPAVATVAIIILLLVTLRRGPQVPRTLREKVRGFVETQLDQKDNRNDHWTLSAERAYDRRQRVRRIGKLTLIRVATALDADPVESQEGFVLDRSSRGLCFASERRYEVGEAIFVLPVSTRPDVPWVAVTIRNCRVREDYFLIGCEFHQPPPVSVLLLFG